MNKTNAIKKQNKTHGQERINETRKERMNQKNERINKKQNRTHRQEIIKEKRKYKRERKKKTKKKKNYIITL